MKTKKLYRMLAAIGSLLSVGMVLGYSLGQGTTNTPLWVGGLLVLLSAVLLGMSLSGKQSSTADESDSSE